MIVGPNPNKYFNSLQSYAKHLADIEHAATPMERGLWLKNVMGETIRDLIRVSFVAGKGPDGEFWMSSSTNTTAGGRFAVSYKRRPSGKAVTDDATRLTDTTQLRQSYKIIRATADEVTVGPTGQRRGTGGRFGTTNAKIAERAEMDWDNEIAGFGPDGGFREQVILKEINRVWDCFIAGVPLSRIRKPTFRAM